MNNENKNTKREIKTDSKLPIERFLEERNQKLMKKEEYENKIKLKAWEMIRVYSEYTGETDLNKIKLNFKTNEEIGVEFNKNDSDEEILWEDMNALNKYIDVLLNTEIQRKKDLETISKIEKEFTESDLRENLNKFTTFSTFIQFVKSLALEIPKVCIISSIFIFLAPYINPTLNGAQDIEWIMLSRMLYATIYSYMLTLVFIKIFQPSSYIKDLFNAIINKSLKNKDLKISSILYYEDLINAPYSKNAISIDNFLSIFRRELNSLFSWKWSYNLLSLTPFLEIQNGKKYKLSEMDNKSEEILKKYNNGYNKSRILNFSVYLIVIVICILLYTVPKVKLFTAILGVSTIVYSCNSAMISVLENRLLSMIYFKEIPEDFRK